MLYFTCISDDSSINRRFNMLIMLKKGSKRSCKKSKLNHLFHCSKILMQQHTISL